MQLLALELGPDADDRPVGVEGLLQELEHRRPALEHVEQALARLELGAARVTEQARGPADVELRSSCGDDVDERRPQPVSRKRRSRVEQARVLERGGSNVRARAPPDDRLLEVRARPVDEAGVDGLLELEHPLRDARRRR